MIAAIVIGLALLVVAFLFMMIIGGAVGNQTKNWPANMAESVNWDAIADAELQSYLPENKINAIKRYRELTGEGLKEAKDAVEFAMAFPDGVKKGRSGLDANTGGAGVRDLITEGRITEAVTVYAAFMGVDEFTAKSAIAELERQLSAKNRLSDDGMDSVRDLLDEGNKIEAIKQYRLLTGVGLKEAKDAVEGM
jgi:ribosomal protein L7/L12